MKKYKREKQSNKKIRIKKKSNEKKCRFIQQRHQNEECMLQQYFTTKYSKQNVKFVIWIYGHWPFENDKNAF